MFDSPSYKHSRIAYIAEAAFEYFVILFVSDAFLAKLLTAIGVSDSLTGIVSSFISLSFLFQLGAIPLLKYIKNVKKVCTFTSVGGNFCFGFLYLIPFLPAAGEYRIVLFILCTLIAYIGINITSTVKFKWTNSFVEPSKRGRYSAVKELISLISGMIVSLILGLVMDRFEAVDDLNGSFLFAAIGIFTFTVCELICLLLVARSPSEDNVTAACPQKSFASICQNTFGNRSFRKVLIFSALYGFGRYFILGFLGTYKNNDLLLPMTLTVVLWVIGNICRSFVTNPFGKYSDKHSYLRGAELGILLEAVSYFVLIFTCPSTWWLFIVQQILFNVGLAGTEQNLLNMVYNYVDDAYFAEASAIRAAVCGLSGFVASLFGGVVLEAIQNNGNVFLGIPLYGQQLLALIAVLILSFTVFFGKKYMEKEKAVLR